MCVNGYSENYYYSNTVVVGRYRRDNRNARYIIRQVQLDNNKVIKCIMRIILEYA